ncbi:type VI secretion system Vgr family protein [Pedobacter caeni]|uniref:Uncharacterized conserved protein, implicated in type VI secretion and phage assembly n=1 Tax=Pedobacter caeni TaxID=288992 RepID=A0A1M5BBY5_9SPHI|nr:phage baseplate assembly protein V [Pedobacter caeni]SHF39662.1 Uncharacterized conserved protein, implicated in type VI secretion and phage assembly [Pedobacter caeni]
MVNKLILDFSIEQIPVTHFSRFTLDQRFNEHHTFELRINHDQLEGTSSITLAKSKDFIGKNLTVQFGLEGEPSNIFTGIITKIEIAQTHGFQGDILIIGHSPDILLERGPDLGSYLDKDLKTILHKATNDTPENDLNFQINPVYRDVIDYIIQYKESDFDFINRLSAQYHEWFYYDGRILHFGKPDKQEEIALVYGRDLHSMQYGMQVAPLSYKKFAYHSQQDELLSAEPGAVSSGSADVSHAISASNEVYSKRFNQPLNVRVNSQKEIETFVNDEQKALVSGLVNITGRGDNPKVGLGKIVDISTSMRNGQDFQVEDFGKFVVTAIHHEIDGIGHYQHTFEGVAADSEKLPAPKISRPFADMQLADVVDNDDPKGQGRVKVLFKWQCQTNDATEWLRVLTPDAGGSVQVEMNRGFVFVPEVGDQILVGFEDGNISKPVVMGSLFHSRNGAGGYDNNHLKSIATRSGHLIEFNDSPGSETITITDKSSNIIRFNTSTSSIEISAPENISIKAKNIDISADQNVSISAGEHIYSNAGGNIATNAGEHHSVMAENITMVANQKINSTATNIEKTAEQINMNSTKENIEFHSTKEIINNSGSKVKLF